MDSVMWRRRALMLAMTGIWSLKAGAQADRPVRVIVPGPTGSAMDAFMRTVSGPWSQQIQQTVVVENLPGAGGTIATAQVARARPDGNTLEIVSSNHVINPSLFKQLSYDAIDSFDPVTIIGVIPIVLVVSPSVTANDMSELVAQIRAQPPGTFNYGSLGIGTVLHLAGELFDSEAQVKTTHIPYKEAAALTADVVNGQVQMAYLALPSVAQLVAAGKLKALGVTMTQRTPALLDVPTIAETLSGYSFDTWLALLAPHGTPSDRIELLYAGLRVAMEDERVKLAIATQGLVPTLTPPSEAKTFLRAELAKYAELVRRSGAVPQ